MCHIKARRKLLADACNCFIFLSYVAADFSCLFTKMWQGEAKIGHCKGSANGRNRDRERERESAHCQLLRWDMWFSLLVMSLEEQNLMVWVRFGYWIKLSAKCKCERTKCEQDCLCMCMCGQFIFIQMPMCAICLECGIVAYSPPVCSSGFCLQIGEI